MNINFYKLNQEEQATEIKRAIKEASPEERIELEDNYRKVLSTKNELVALLNGINGTEFTANDKIVFTETDNGIEITQE